MELKALHDKRSLSGASALDLVFRPDCALYDIETETSKVHHGGCIHAINAGGVVILSRVRKSRSFGSSGRKSEEAAWP